METFKKFGILLTIFAIVITFMSGLNWISISLLILSLDCVMSYVWAETLDNDKDDIINNSKIIWNKLIPFGSYCTIMLFGLIFCKHSKPETQKEIDEFAKTHLRHEFIHKDQFFETGYLIFYLLYCIEFLCYLVVCFNWNKSYKNISFEREANELQTNHINRKSYGWVKYWFDFKNLKQL